MKKRTANLHIVMQVELPSETCLDELNVGLANVPIMRRWNKLEEAKVSSWWIERVEACNTRYVTCPHCKKIEMMGSDAVILDGKPLCILCSAQFEHGDIPHPATTPSHAD